jgi:hypothetical protein
MAHFALELSLASRYCSRWVLYVALLFCSTAPSYAADQKSSATQQATQGWQLPFLGNWQLEGGPSSHHQFSSESIDPETSRKHSQAIRNKSRFLGWKYARLTHQQISSRSQHVASPAPAVRSGSAVNRQFQRANAGFGNAGFGFRTGLPTGYIPTSVVAGDFNGDGKMDIAISNGGDNTVYVLLGNGDNTFQVPEILYTQGQSPVWITGVQLRTSGHLDLVVVDGDSNLLETFVGNGDGTFQPGVQVQLPQIPTYVVAGDFNKDGNQDVAVGLVVPTATNAPQFEVLLGDGTGAFSSVVVPPSVMGSLDGPIPTGWIAEADLNNDGYPDLVTTVTGGSAITYVNQAGVGFSQSAPFAPIGYAMVVELGDVNEDGCVDAVELSAYGTLTIGLGTCDGNFKQGNPIADLGDLDPAAKVVDVDGDGHLDVVASSAFYFEEDLGYGAEGGYLVSVLKGDGKGNFSSASMYRGGRDEYSLAVTDLNGDGKPEIVTVDSSEYEASLFINTGSGGYDGPSGEAIGYLTGAVNAPIPGTPIIPVDVNGDGKPDLVVLEAGPLGQQSQITTMLNDGTGKFLPAVRSAITVGPQFPFPLFVPGAFRSAGKNDLIYVTQYGPQNLVAFIPNTGNGTFGAATLLTDLPNPTQAATGDFNGDGKLDFVVLQAPGNGTFEFDVFLGHGDGTFAELAPQIFTVSNGGSPERLFAVDLNHDGKLDLLVSNNANGGWTLTGDDLIEALGNGDGTFQAPKTLISHFGPVAVVDVNKDGYLDLIQGRDPSVFIGGSIFTPVAITVYLGTASGSFEQQPSYDLSGYTFSAVYPLVGDFNGDGIPDIAIGYIDDIYHDLTEQRLRVLQGVGDGSLLVSNHTYLLPALSDPVLGMDFNGDGATDLIELVGYTSSFHTINAAQAPSLDIALDSNPVVGNSGSATVSLDLPASVAEDVTLTASDPAIQLPPSVHFNVGQQTQDFAFTLGTGFDQTHAMVLYATLNSETALAYGSKPNPNAVVGVSTEVTQNGYQIYGGLYIVPGQNLALEVKLQSESGYTGTFSFECSALPANGACSFSPGSVQILPGYTEMVSLNLSTTSSTPLGNYSVEVNSTDGFTQSSGILQLGVGDFSLTASPSILLVGPSGSVMPTVTSTAVDGLNETVTLTCSGLPQGVTCQPQQTLGAQGNSPLQINYSGLAAKDYPLQIVGTIGPVSHQVSEVLRVGDFSATLSATSATLSAGQSATFTVALASINQFTDTISVTCQPPNNELSCTVSPTQVSLTGGGQASIKLTINASSTAASLAKHARRAGRGLGYSLFALFIPLYFICGRARTRYLSLLLIGGLLALACASWGGGSSNSNSVPSGGGGGSQVLTVQVNALANSFSDSSNQKTLGPIVITLK